jgi:hypothetical protein
MAAAGFSAAEWPEVEPPEVVSATASQNNTMQRYLIEVLLTARASP